MERVNLMSPQHQSIDGNWVGMPVDTLQAIVNYLVDRPYKDVAPLIQLIESSTQKLNIEAPQG